jgi:hypothetical protein
MSFSSAFRAGSDVADDWITSYRQNKEQEVSDQMLSGLQSLAREKQIRDEENNLVYETTDNILNSSPQEKVGQLLEGFAAMGGKIDDNTARLAFGAVQAFDGFIDTYKRNEQKNEMFNAKLANHYQVLRNRKDANYRANQVFEMKKNHKWNPSGKPSVTQSYEQKTSGAVDPR